MEVSPPVSSESLDYSFKTVITLFVKHWIPFILEQVSCKHHSQLHGRDTFTITKDAVSLLPTGVCSKTQKICGRNYESEANIDCKT